MKKITTYLVAAIAVFGLAAMPLFTEAVVVAQADKICEGVNATGGSECGTEAGGSQLTDLITNVINMLLFIGGIVAVLFLIIGGIRYVVSNGDSSQITAARQTILYAIIGLVVSIMAYAIVNFVVGALD